MAVFNYDNSVVYNERGGGEQFDRGAVTNTPGSLDAIDDTFSLGETIGGVGEYIGFYIQGTDSYPVFRSGSQLRIYAPEGRPAATEDPFGLNQDLEELAMTICFAAGTLIATPEGERAVEALAIGDFVTTADGRAVPVLWIGRQTVMRLFSGERATPVRVLTGALGGGLPHADLVLTAEHALILDGLAINAVALVNGSSIIWERDVADRAIYYHIETEEHDVILANGAAAEPYIDYIGRTAFDNYDEYVALYGDDRTICEMDMPRISTARLVPPSLKSRLAGVRAA